MIEKQSPINCRKKKGVYLSTWKEKSMIPRKAYVWTEYERIERKKKKVTREMKWMNKLKMEHTNYY
jgi:hypothetical protein